MYVSLKTWKLMCPPHLNIGKLQNAALWLLSLWSFEDKYENYMMPWWCRMKSHNFLKGLIFIIKIYIYIFEMITCKGFLIENNDVANNTISWLLQLALCYTPQYLVTGVLFRCDSPELSLFWDPISLTEMLE